MSFWADKQVLPGLFDGLSESHVDPVIKIAQLAASASSFEIPHALRVVADQPCERHGESHHHPAEATACVLAWDLIGEAIGHCPVVEQNDAVRFFGHLVAFFQFSVPQNSQGPDVDVDPVSVGVSHEEHHEERRDAREMKREHQHADAPDFFQNTHFQN